MTLARTLIATVALAALAACGRQEPPAAPAAAPQASTPAPAAATTAPATPAATEVAAAPAANDTGKATYGKVCVMCHGAGIGGAPKIGDKAAWGPRIAQGQDTLYKHALEGFTGSQGMMPAKGGGANLSDDDVKAAVDHMVAAGK
ncbi:c-type cytochrome [Rubrivivax gelatinosus]|uniref:Cytochrome c5 NosC n=1 Tax=Rubrivivax gelatinosus (strain NBRC 100245 / IL144) TaxID=983917 RepID=I0HQH6_RUBGI|nr:c-type cytochrome [Rubrivivax gelatinosus]BAL95263.1 cytochrome c5 NosC [Rubrivivax gelatinosus IL144]